MERKLTIDEFIEKMGTRVCSTYHIVKDKEYLDLKLRFTRDIFDDEKILKRGNALIKLFNILRIVDEVRTDKNVQEFIDSYDAYQESRNSFLDSKKILANIDKLLFESWSD